MGPTWELLDKVGIVLGILLAFVEIAQWIVMWRMNEEMEEMQEDIEDIQEDVDEL